MTCPGRSMVLRYRDELALFRGPARKVGLLVLLGLFLWLPLVLGNFWASVLVLAGITAVGALGLNLLTGYTGQGSLGHAFFVGVGAYAASYLGRPVAVGGHGLPFPVYLVGAAVVGGLIGFLVGLPTLRLRGNYLIIVTLGLVFLGQYLFAHWNTVTGGPAGTSMPVHVYLFGSDFTSLPVGNRTLGRNQGLFYLAWGLAAIVALLVRNVVRTRPGRALQAVRDRDVAAEVVGVSLYRYKLAAFTVSSAIAAVAGVLYGLYLQNLSPDTFNLQLSIQYLAVIIVGGIGTVSGSIIGAIIVGGLPAVVDHYAANLPFLTSSTTGAGLTKGIFEEMLFGVLIIVFLVQEPGGVADQWRRIRAYFRTWPFSD